MSTGILSDIFSEDKRGLVMSIFNWGIYGGYGIAFPVGRYVPAMNTWDLVSHEGQAPTLAVFRSRI
jgi:MFS family permease